MKNWEVIADNLSKAGWSWGCVDDHEPEEHDHEPPLHDQSKKRKVGMFMSRPEHFLVYL